MFWSKKKKQKFLFKANNDVLSFCSCDTAPALSEGQLDCPWCGCGWMIACSNCSKSFVFAEVRETDIPLTELARREASVRGMEDVTEAEITDWAKGMAEKLADFDVGDIVVYLDGVYWKATATNVQFDGLYAAHALARLPHAEALDNPPHLRAVLGDQAYWRDRELPDRA